MWPSSWTWWTWAELTGASTGLGRHGGESSVLFLLPDGWTCTRSHPVSTSDCDDTAKAGAHSASRGAHRLHHPLGRCGVRGKYSSSFFWPLCCCISLLQRFSLNIMVCFLLIVLWGVLFLTFLSDQRVQVHCLITQQYLLKKMVQI